MSISDGVGLAQAAALALAAWFAWRTYQASRIEHRREPRRRLLVDALSELKNLAREFEFSPDTPGLVRGAQRRLALALAPIRWIAMNQTVFIAHADRDEIGWHEIQDAMADINYALGWLELDPKGLGEEPLSWGDGDRPPLREPQHGIRRRFRQLVVRWRLRKEARAFTRS